jgi:hypothetical protein
MNSGLRKLVKAYREETGCPPPSEPDWEPPCPTCRVADAVLAETWRPLDWAADGPIVAEVAGGKYATVEQAEGKWAWRLEVEDGWEMKVTHSGTDASLMDALYAAERAARGL